MRLRHASAADAGWLAATLGEISHGFGSRIERQPGGRLILRPSCARIWRRDRGLPRPAAAPPGGGSGARVAFARSGARCRRFREQQQFMRPPRCLLDVTVLRFGHRAALQAPGEDLKCLGDRRQLALKPTDTLGKAGGAVAR